MIREAKWWHRILDLAFRSGSLMLEIIGFVLIIWIVAPLAALGWLMEKWERKP